MNFRYYVRFILIFVFSASLVSAQNTKPCNLSLEEAPILRGIRLQMSSEEVSKELQVEIKLIQQTGLSEGRGNNPIEFNVPNAKWFSLNDDKIRKLKISNLDGVDKLWLDFYQNKLFSISISYSQNLDWKDIKEFVRVISEKLNLPFEAWTFTEDIYNHFKIPQNSHSDKSAQLSCNNFHLFATLSENYFTKPTLILSDEVTRKKVDTLYSQEREKVLDEENRKIEEEKKKRELEEENRKKSFKP